MNLARKAVIVGQYADHDVTIRVRRSGTPRSGFVQQVVSADIVLVDGLFDQTHPKKLRIKLMVLAHIGGHSGDVMDSE
jgi:hypothetical protein